MKAKALGFLALRGEPPISRRLPSATSWLTPRQSTTERLRAARDVRPPLRPGRLLLALLVNTAAVFFAAAILPDSPSATSGRRSASS